MGDTNPLRTCSACGIRDADPRHATDHGGGVVTTLHMDCCALANDCELCHQQIKDAKGAKGDALRAHLVSLTASTPEV